MTRQLVFVHGRSQEKKDSVQLKSEWIEAFRKGLAKNGLKLPIDEVNIRFPYYGDTLYDLVADKSEEEVAKIIVRGDGIGESETHFIRAMLLEIQEQSGVTDAQVEALAGDTIQEKGILNSKWVQKVLEALDTYVPGASGASVALATRDVYQYLRNPGFQNVIDTGVRSAFLPGVETVVVGHSLGSIVSYRLLQREGHSLGWKIPLYVTVGAPLAVKVVKELLSPIKHPQCVTSWFNAMDDRDVVSLYPLDQKHFSVDPPIENKTDVDNPTENRHGISGYLSDVVVAKRIHDALKA